MKFSAAVHALARKHLTPNALVFLKGFSPQHGLYIKAVGVVKSDFKPMIKSLGEGGVEVDWKWPSVPGEVYYIGKLGDKSDYSRRGVFYEEANTKVTDILLQLLFNPGMSGNTKSAPADVDNES